MPTFKLMKTAKFIVYLCSKQDFINEQFLRTSPSLLKIILKILQCNVNITSEKRKIIVS